MSSLKCASNEENYCDIKCYHICLLNECHQFFLSFSFQMHSGGGRVLAAKQKSAFSVYVGIVSLVLEGRALGDDDDDDNFLRSQSPHLNLHHVQHSTPTHHELDVEVSNSSNVTGGSRHGVINLISEKLMRLRQFPGTSKEIDVVEMAIPMNSDEYERQPRLHHVASAREFQRNLRLTSIPTSSASNSSAAASVLHDIDVDWNDISILLNGLDSIVKVPAFPLKIPSPAHPSTNLHHLAYPRPSSNAMSINQKLLASKNRMPEKSTCGSPSSSSNAPSSLKPRQGPHCEKFLKKLGLFKVDLPESLETDHMCNHVNSFVR